MYYYFNMYKFKRLRCLGYAFTYEEVKEFMNDKDGLDGLGNWWVLLIFGVIMGAFTPAIDEEEFKVEEQAEQWLKDIIKDINEIQMKIKYNRVVRPKWRKLIKC